VHPELLDYTRSNLNAGIEKVFGKLKPGDNNYDFVQKLRNNAQRFAAYKSAWQTAELKEVDDVDGIGAINKMYNTNYMRTEYEHTVRSSRAAKNWQNFEADKDLYPYLEYIPSTAAEPRNEHKRLYGVIKPMNDPFWDTWMPPADWGCQCSVQQRRSDKGTTQPPDDMKLPPATMRNNPGKDGQIFTDKHPMIAKVGNKNAGRIEDVIKNADKVINGWNEFKSLNINWIKDSFDDLTGGFSAFHKHHKFDPVTGDFEKQAARIFAKDGHQMLLLDEKSGDKQFDTHLLGMNTDIKVIFSEKKIVTRAGDAIKQNAKCVIFYLAKDIPEEYLYKRLRSAYNTHTSLEDIWFIRDGKPHNYKK